MTVGALLEQLKGTRRLAMDAGPFMRYVDGTARYEKLSLALFEHIEQGRVEAFSSILTLNELLVGPYKAHDEATAQEFNLLWPTFPHLTLVGVTQAIADRAARLSAHYPLELAASLQAATALLSRADLLITSDKAMTRLAGEIRILVLEECL
jgi:predicted nucleic acid-binding protein